MTSQPPPINGVDHIKLPSIDISKTHDFYIRVLGFTTHPEFDHRTQSGDLFAVICEHTPSSTLLEVRRNPDQAAKQHHWDPVTWSVETRADLEKWAKWFDECGVKRSPVFTAMRSWLLMAEDPDGRFVRLMTKETHEWTTDFSKDEYWLG